MSIHMLAGAPGTSCVCERRSVEFRTRSYSHCWGAASRILAACLGRPGLLIGEPAGWAEKSPVSFFRVVDAEEVVPVLGQLLEPSIDPRGTNTMRVHPDDTHP